MTQPLYRRVNGKYNTTTYAYDNMGRMSKVTDSQGSVTAYAYDLVGNLIGITDAEGHTTSNAYDSLGRVTKITDPLGFITQYSYDAQGNLTNKTDANNRATEYEYDALSRLIKIFYGGKISPVKTIIFSYNKAGNMLTWDDGVYSAVHSYDGLNRVNNVTTTYPFGAKTISYEYDKAGNRTRVIAPTGVIASPLGEAIYTYDVLNRLTSLNYGTSIVDYSYDNMSRLIKKTLPNGVYTDYSYDNLNRLISLINKKSAGDIISSFTYAHDKVGNRLSMATPEGMHNYVYDDIYRLTNAAHPIGSPESYTYDKVGNRKTSRDYPTWNYDANNRLTSFNGTTFTYDNNGNTISKTKSGQTINYAYDYENKLISVDSGLSTRDYSYDPFGRRLSKTVNGVTKYYLYDNEDIVAEYDSSGNHLASYIHGQGIDEPISMVRNNNTYYYTFDGLGSVSELSDDSQNVVEAYKYDAFGNLSIYDSSYVLRPSSLVGNFYTYTSREYDLETGLYYYRARHFSSTIGRFLQQDPLGYTADINVYIYCLNSPTNWIDPFGEDVYYINNKFNHSTPTIWPLSHSFVAITEKDPTGKQKVQRTYSWVDTKGGMWEDSNKEQNKEGAQKAIDSGKGAWKKGDESLDKYVDELFEKRKGEQGGFWPGKRGTCKDQANKLINDAIKRRALALAKKGGRQ